VVRRPAVRHVECLQNLRGELQGRSPPAGDCVGGQAPRHAGAEGRL